MDMSKLLAMLSKMDKKDLENGLKHASKILDSKEKNSIIDTLKNNTDK